MLSASTAHLNYQELDSVLNQPETEHNWAAKETAIKTLGSACHSSIAQNLEFISFIKNHRKALSESLLTERTRLSGTACELVEKLSASMGRDFGLHFSDLFTGTLLKVCARTNKVMVSRAVKALNSIINAGCLAPLPKACQAFATNNKALRIACIGLIASCIAQYSSHELEHFLPVFEPVLKEGVSDAAPEVRDTSRKSYKIYAEKFPEQSQRINTVAVKNCSNTRTVRRRCRTRS
ncbi:clasp N-terminal domain-containing protein [Dissophora ornata]|nr:clasp N-terminal domain-containing protein [Dissophora ornata]